MKVIIAGSRTILDYLAIVEAVRLSQFDITEVVSGTAFGVDRLGERWAVENKIPLKRFPADWRKEGKRAGLIRNEKMADYADALIAVWDGKSRGTEHMINAAYLKDRMVYIHTFAPKEAPPRG